MKRLHVFHALMAVFSSLLPVMAQANAGHSMGGHSGMAPRVSAGPRGMAPRIFGGRVGMPPHITRSRGFGHKSGRFDHRPDFAFRNHDFDQFRDRHDRFRDGDSDRNDRFFRHHADFFGFDFASFGFPWWYPYPCYDYPYYDYPYDYSYYDYGPAYDYQYWNDLAVSVQSELARRGYYKGAIDGVIGSGSREAIRAFQAAQGLPVTGVIDRKVWKALGISYRNGNA